ncbi:MAG: recombination protein U [Bacilli bacterium]|nr:recombination protein U [Bacilli bacterium]
MKYPNGIKKGNNNLITHSNRGMSLEEDLNQTNEYYLLHDIANIHKKPTSITIKKVDYTKNDMICEAYFKTPSTTDYNGVYKGYYIDFEAKETRQKTSFPLANIHKHQIEHLINIKKHGGIGFLIVKFTLLNKIYYLSIDDLENYLNNNQSSSIPISYFEKYGQLIEEKYNPRINYLTCVEVELNERNNRKIS